MALKTGLRLGQSQRLALTPALRQSIRILQIPASSLEDMIAEEIAENPFLEYRAPHYQGAVVDHQIALDTIAQPVSLPEYLSQQIRMMKAPDTLVELACYLAWNLTEEGFLADDPWTISEELETDQSTVREAARLLQACEPAGIGAYGLKHSLDLQLIAQGEPPASRLQILANIRSLTTEPDALISSKLDISVAEVQRFRNLLRSLSPRPAELLTAKPAETLTPDIRVIILPGSELLVEPVDRATPSLDLDLRLYESSRSAASEHGQEMEAQFRRAQDLIRAIVSRQKTILRIGHELCTNQAGFFLNGPEYLQPMTQASVAQALDIHPSTLSRAVAHKSLACSQGVFPLSFFFTRAIGDAETGVSSFVVQQEIQRIIKSENPSEILSDAQIATKLCETGVDIARRTVAKYRQCLNIPSSTTRRRSKNFL